MRVNTILSLICEDFNIDEDVMKINQALLSEDSSPIELIDNNKQQNNDIEETSDEITDDVLDMLDIDTLADKLEDDDNSTLHLSIDNPKVINVNIEPQEKIHLKVFENDDDDNIDDTLTKDIDSLNVILKNNDNINVKLTNNSTNSDDTINLKIKKDKQINAIVNDKDNSNDNIINVNLNDDVKSTTNDDNTIHVDLKDKDNDDGDIQLSLKKTKDLKNVDDTTINLKLNNDINGINGDKDTIHIKLMNVEKELSDKIGAFISKRDELISSQDPNLQLTTCLKIISNMKKSLERLINYVPDEVILAKTKYFIGDILDNLTDNSAFIMNNPDKMKKVIYKVFDVVISVNKYIEEKYIQIEEKIDTSSKDKEDKDIDKQIIDVKKNNLNKKLNNDQSIDNNNGFLNGNNSVEINNNNNDNDDDKDTTFDKKPNINKRRM